MLGKIQMINSVVFKKAVWWSIQEIRINNPGMVREDALLAFLDCTIDILLSYIAEICKKQFPARQDFFFLRPTCRIHFKQLSFMVGFCWYSLLKTELNQSHSVSLPSVLVLHFLYKASINTIIHLLTHTKQQLGCRSTCKSGGTKCVAH